MSKPSQTFSLTSSGTTIEWLEPKIPLSNHYKNGAEQPFATEPSKPAAAPEAAESGGLARVRQWENWILMEEGNRVVFVVKAVVSAEVFCSHSRGGVSIPAAYVALRS